MAKTVLCGLWRNHIEYLMTYLMRAVPPIESGCRHSQTPVLPQAMLRAITTCTVFYLRRHLRLTQTMHVAIGDKTLW